MNALDVLKYGHLTFLKTLEGVPLTRRTLAGVCGVWSVKDIVAHIASYESLLDDVLGQFAEGSSTPTLDLWLSGPAAFNDDQVALRRDQSPDEALVEYMALHTGVMTRAARVATASWSQPGTLPWYGADYSLDDFVTYQYYGHKREHSAEIAAFIDREQRQTTTDLPASVERLFSASNRRDIAGIMAALTDDCVFENTFPPPDGERFAGQQAIRSFWEQLFAASPEVSFEIEEHFTSGERVCVRWLYRWTDSSGHDGHVRGVDVLRLRDGAVAEKLSYVKG